MPGSPKQKGKQGEEGRRRRSRAPSTKKRRARLPASPAPRQRRSRIPSSSQPQSQPPQVGPASRTASFPTRTERSPSVKQGPSFWRIAAMVIFALSCFGILTFLWVSFGGSVPLKPQAYEVMVDFPEATTLAEQADVRISGVPVGKVQKKQLDGNVHRSRRCGSTPSTRRCRRTPRRSCARRRCSARPTWSSRRAPATGPKLPDGGTLAQGNVAQTVQLDEIFRAFDPKTRAAFRTWLDQQGRAFNQRGTRPERRARQPDPVRSRTPTTLLQVLNEQQADTRKLVRQHGRRVRRPHRARRPAALADRRTRTACSRPPPRATRSCSRSSRSSRPSSTSRAPPPPGSPRSRATRTR